MKIKMNNAVGPQVRTAKPKPSKLLPVLGAASMVGGLQAATQFFADIEGVPGDPRVDTAFEELAFQTNGVRLLGSYAQARKRG